MGSPAAPYRCPHPLSKPFSGSGAHLLIPFNLSNNGCGGVALEGLLLQG